MGQANLALTYLISNNIRIVVEGGYLYWFSFDPTQAIPNFPGLFQHYGGIFVGAGVTIKF